MKILILIEKYGGYCNRFFQSLHYHAYAIENNIIFFNFSMLGLLKFNNSFYYFFDKINNFLLSILSKFFKSLLGKNDICFYLNKENYIRIVNGWDFRNNFLTEKYHNELKELYTFERKNFSKNIVTLVNHLENLKRKGKYVVGLHIRRNDYKRWNNGKYYYSDEFYKFVIKTLRFDITKNNKDPIFVVLSDEKVSSKIGFDFLSKGSWKEDQIVLQSCNLLVGPPSTFTMWASYISQIPLIKLKSSKSKTFYKSKICKG